MDRIIEHNVYCLL